MKLDDIFKEWNIDSEIDGTNLGNEALKISQLHNKYYKIFINERLLYRKYTEEAKVLKQKKYEFYTLGPDEDSDELGWELPPQGRILKQEASQYVDTDPDIINMNLKIGIIQEKIELLESIIKSLVNRGFNIKAAIDYERFKAGSI